MSSVLRSLSPRVLAVLAWVILAAPLAHADEPIDPPGRVARVSVALGTVSLEPAGSDQWVADVLNRPLTNDDRLWSDRESRAELHVGSTAIRLGAETGVGILNIDDHAVQLRLSSGTLQVRVRSLEPDETLEIATPAASVAVLRPGSYRIDVNERGDELHVAVLQGQVAVTDANGAQTVDGGQLADFYGSVDQMQLGDLPPGDAFDQWTSERDRREDRAVSTRYVSRDTIGYEDLDDYGTWRTVDEYGPVWVPTVAMGWSPYRDGHWAWIAPWGWTWIDDAPWGFAPFHYGRWVHVRGDWCWAPGPRHRSPLYAPALVGWVGGGGVSIGVSIGGPPIGWFPLGWNEVYEPSYRHSRGYVQNVNITNIHVTNTYVTNYIDGGGRDRGGRDRDGDARDRRAPTRYANLAVNGALISTSREAFTGSKRIGEHLTRLPPGALERMRPQASAPAIAPSRESIGRPAAVEPRREMWTRPVIARVPPPPPAASFDSQRRAVIANGGHPVAIERGPAPRRDAPEATLPARPDPVHVIRGDVPMRSGAPSPAYAPLPGVRPPRTGAESPRNAAPPVAPVAPASPTAPANRGDRPPASYRPPPPSEWRREAPAEPRGVDSPRPPPVSPVRPAPEQRPTYDRPVTPPTPEPGRYEQRPSPPPAYEPPSRPAPTYDAPRRPTYDRPAASTPVPEPRRYEQRPSPPPAYEAPSRPAPTYDAPQRPTYDRPAAPEPRRYEQRPSPPPEPRAVAPREWSPPPAPPAVREFRPPPPPPAAPAPPPASHSAPPPAEKPHPDKPHPDPRDR